MPPSCTIGVRLKPNAKQDEIKTGPDGLILARVHAPPLEGKANAALIALLAETLDLPKSSISIRHGLASKKKLVKVIGLTKEEVTARVLR
ncbi:MAG TPA: DUF167 family protein [Chitinivibrionales bacterium]|jgi:uncharacterized protein YggU (UPF0235/DUF167 family)|nr:DUF167 family protein [Chitinivibrionales bacterium]